MAKGGRGGQRRNISTLSANGNISDSEIIKQRNKINKQIEKQNKIIEANKDKMISLNRQAREAEHYNDMNKYNNIKDKYYKLKDKQNNEKEKLKKLQEKRREWNDKKTTEEIKKEKGEAQKQYFRDKTKYNEVNKTTQTYDRIVKRKNREFNKRFFSSNR